MNINLIVTIGVPVLTLFLTFLLLRRTGAKSAMSIIRAAGFLYDKCENIFYSRINAWQRRFGYCKAYDELAAAFGMVIDCEPLYFEYDGRRWLIELWKGQYGMTCGCEAGVYKSSRFFVNKNPRKIIYKKVRKSEFLNISLRLYTEQGELFSRQGRHWWLTGFRLGECQAPEKLSMDITIEFESIDMRNAFISALRTAGYNGSNMAVLGRRVFVRYTKPFAKQPISDTAGIMTANEMLCKAWNNAAKGETNMEALLEKVHINDPDLFAQATAFPRTKPLYRVGKRHMRGEL